MIIIRYLYIDIFKLVLNIIRIQLSQVTLLTHLSKLGSKKQYIYKVIMQLEYRKQAIEYFKPGCFSLQVKKKFLQNYEYNNYYSYIYIYIYIYTYMYTYYYNYICYISCTAENKNIIDMRDMAAALICMVAILVAIIFTYNKKYFYCSPIACEDKEYEKKGELVLHFYSSPFFCEDKEYEKKRLHFYSSPIIVVCEDKEYEKRGELVLPSH